MYLTELAALVPLGKVAALGSGVLNLNGTPESKGSVRVYCNLNSLVAKPFYRMSQI